MVINAAPTLANFYTQALQFSKKPWITFRDMLGTSKSQAMSATQRNNG